MALSITLQPVDVRTIVDSLETFSTAVDGSIGTLYYQWYRNDEAVGTDSDTLTINPVAGTDAGEYYCHIEDIDEEVTIDTIDTEHVFLYLDPTIITQPQNTQTTVGGNLLFSVEASGNPATLSYQWYKGVTPVGTNSDSLDVQVVDGAEGGYYSVRVTSDSESIDSDQVEALIEPSITVQPSNTTAPVGGTLSFSVTATGNPATLTYAWTKDGSPVVGGNSDTLDVTVVDGTESGAYQVEVNSDIGTIEDISDVATGLVEPTIDTQPEAAEAAVGENVCFTVAASGNPATLAYQWYKGLVPVGTNSDSLCFNPAHLVNAGLYHAVVTSDGMTVTSDEVELTVTGTEPSGPSITISNPAQATLQQASLPFLREYRGRPVFYVDGHGVPHLAIS